MGRKMVVIESKYGSGGNFKPMIKLPTIVGTLTLLHLNYKEEID